MHDRQWQLHIVTPCAKTVCMLQCVQMCAQCCCPDCCGCLMMQRGRCTLWFGHSEAHAHADSATSCPLLISYTLLYLPTLQIQHFHPHSVKPSTPAIAQLL